MAREELLVKLSMFEQQAQEVNEQMKVIDSQINEMGGLKLSLSKVGKKTGEMLANLGRGIFLKTNIKDEKVFMNVGSKVLVKKSFSEAGEVVDGQINELLKIKEQLMNNLKNINAGLGKLVEEANKQS